MYFFPDILKIYHKIFYSKYFTAKFYILRYSKYSSYSISDADPDSFLSWAFFAIRYQTNWTIFTQQKVIWFFKKLKQYFVKSNNITLSIGTDKLTNSVKYYHVGRGVCREIFCTNFYYQSIPFGPRNRFKYCFCVAEIFKLLRNYRNTAESISMLLRLLQR